MIAIALTASIVYAVTWSAARKQYTGEDGDLVAAVRELRDIIREHYFYYDADEKQLTDGVLKGLAAATGDTYAEYYTKEEYADLTKQNDRTFIGIGILTQVNANGDVEILEVYDNTPASEAGLEPGDLIREINGTGYEGLTLNDFLANVQAEDGAANTFVIQRGEEMLSFEIVAREVHTPAVSYRMLTDTIGYIHLLSFHGTCVEETQTAIKELREAGMRSLVFDFRDNLGGSLYDAIDIADIFLPKDYIVTTLRSRDGDTVEYKTKQSGLDIRMVLLLNEYSASASELVAGAFKDYGAAYLIGTKTYGKGIVQSFFEIKETKGWIKITTDAYYTPNGVCVQDHGIIPDEVVELSEEAQSYSIDRIPFDLDLQLQAAIAYLED
ncbi:MAG: S41 family peptidase [Clostridia bacterium]|nr:S41 family peptidase [Clostridia bacterium]